MVHYMSELQGKLQYSQNNQATMAQQVESLQYELYHLKENYNVKDEEIARLNREIKDIRVCN